MPKEPQKCNSICEKCLHKCKQLDTVQLLSCPRYEAQPVQLEIKVPGLDKRR
ncbi:MAG: hypothetical protein PHQ78_00020 [Candidatus Cloacimonetes bacterium]|nr:hypothetical protein [Candidatus Cloacimonadota bacterium]MDD2505693.1 hypothetical protein [Candidatus Cloacimonadota bacterium]MDD4559115.1 hypothetical protein [Candidatus Cloacimonadota bacterium]